jgi:hypothetical protein
VVEEPRVLADNHNLFGADGNAGVEGFTPGPADIVPPAGVLLPDILNPTLAFNGGPTQTHALVPGSPAIDAGGAVCLDAKGETVAVDFQIGLQTRELFTFLVDLFGEPVP